VILKTWDFSAEINDSKLLSPKARETAFKEIIQKASVGIGIVDEKIIDKINIYRATSMAMHQAVMNLPEQPDILLVDGKVPIPCSQKKVFIIKGDRKSLSIACASIIAKVTRDRIMAEFDQKYPQYGFMKHKGYGTRQHMLSLKNFGPCPIHRRSFRPVSEMSENTFKAVDTEALISYNQHI